MKWPGFDIENPAENIYVFRKPRTANLGLCVGRDDILLIDTGYTPGTAAAVIDAVTANWNRPITLVFNTHYHSDHTFGNQQFSCPIVSSEKCRDRMRLGPSSFWSPEEIADAKKEDPRLAEDWRDLTITFPTRVFDCQLSVNIGGLEVIFRRVGGHTAGSSIAHILDLKLAFVGDIIFSGCYPTLLPDGDPLQLVDVLRTITSMDLDVIVPGHGPACDKTAAVPLIDYWDGLVGETGPLVDSGRADQDIISLLERRCHLPSIPYDQRKHRRNIETVLGYVRRKNRPHS